MFFYRQIIIIIILLIIILIWYIIFNLIYNTINITNHKIENFVTSNLIKFTYDDLNGKQLMTNKISIIPKGVDSTLNYYNYYSLFEKIDTDDSFHFNVYSSFNTTTTSTSDSSNYFSRIFTNSDTNNPCVFNYSSNIILLDKDIGNGQKASLKSYFVVDFINSDYNDTKFRIMSISIAVDNSSVTNQDKISFYYCSNTSDTVLPETSQLIQLNYIGAPLIETKSGNINIYTFKFYDRENGISPPSIDDITINFNTSNYKTVPIRIYYIKIFGLPENTYSRIERQLRNPSIFNDPTSDSTSIMRSADVTTIDVNLGDLMTSANAIDKYDIQKTIFDSTNLADVFRKIIRNNTPWGIYNGGGGNIIYRSNINSVVLSDLLGRKCRDGIINNVSENDISYVVTYEDSLYKGLDINDKEITVTKRIEQFKGTTSMNIIFPVGSLPNKYTICAITRYIGSSSHGRIVTAKNYSPIDFLLGHWGNNTNVMRNQDWYSTSGINGGDNSNWVVSCAKTTGNYNEKSNDGTYNTILFNGKSSGRSNFIGNGINSDNKNSEYVLTINGLSSEVSNFGLTYIIIWDYILSDSELKLMSKNLINTVIDDSYKLPISEIVIENAGDGLSSSTAATSPYEIVQNSCTNKNDYYYININGRSQPIYCILDRNIGNFGGGWMLAMKGAKYSTRFQYDSEYWTSYNTLNNETRYENLLSDTTTEIKTNVFNYYKFIEVLIIFNDTSRFAPPYYKTSYYKLNNPGLKTKDANNNEIGTISLADFFRSNLNDFYYTNSNNNFRDLNYITEINSFNNISSSGIIRKNSESFDNNWLGGSFNFTKDTFSRQSVARAYGLNLNFVNPRHRVRIGAVYNENPGYYFDSIDVSNGIGLYPTMRGKPRKVGPTNYSSGDIVGCCESSYAINDGLPFLLFVR